MGRHDKKKNLWGYKGAGRIINQVSVWQIEFRVNDPVDQFSYFSPPGLHAF